MSGLRFILLILIYMCALIHGCFEKCNPLKSHQMQLHPRNVRLLHHFSFELYVPRTVNFSCSFDNAFQRPLFDWSALSYYQQPKYPLYCRLFACSYIAKKYIKNVYNYIKNVYNYITSFRCPCSKPWDVWSRSITFFICLTK